MIISNSRRFVFVHIHKAGGTSIEVGLAPHLAWNDIVLGGPPEAEAINAPFSALHGLHKHSGLKDIARICGPEVAGGYFSFALVREPVARAVSLYNYIADFSARLGRLYRKSHDEMARAAIEGDDEITHGFIRWDATRAYYLTEGFGAFIRSADTRRDMGFAPQAASLQAEGGLAVQQIIKLEELPLRLPELWQALGLRFAVPHANRPETRAIAPDQVSQADRLFLHDLFAEDYLALDYG